MAKALTVDGYLLAGYDFSLWSSREFFAECGTGIFGVGRRFWRTVRGEVAFFPCGVRGGGRKVKGGEKSVSLGAGIVYA